MGDVLDRMTWDLDFAGRSTKTKKVYLSDVRAFGVYCGVSPECVGQTEVRAWVEHLLERGVKPSRLRQHLAALVFLFRKTLGRPEAVSFFAWPKDELRLPTVLSLDEVGKLLDALPEGSVRMLFRTIFALGLRISEGCGLRIDAVDAKRGVIQVMG